MAFISSRIDRALVLGRGAIGSHQLADLSVYREKLARSAVGSGQQGTITAARLIGTVSNLDIGSGFFSYGSAGTWAGRFSRGQTGSFSGTFTARRFQTRGAAAGIDAGVIFGAYGSLTGTVRAPIVRGPRGSFGTAQGFFRGRFAAQGRYLTGSVGSFSRTLGAGGAVGSFGSITGPLHRGRSGSFGSMNARFYTGARGSATGTWAFGKISPRSIFGTVTPFSVNEAGSPYPPPPRLRFISVNIQFTSTGQRSGMILTQERYPPAGTISRVRREKPTVADAGLEFEVQLQGWLFPQFGSYRFRSYGSAANVTPRDPKTFDI